MAARLLFLLLAVCGLATTQYQATWDSLDKRPLPKWYDEAKLGIFMHWGVFSVPSFSSEWFWEQWKGQKNPKVVQFMEKNYPPDFEYPDFAPMFKAELFDPNQWAKLFQDSGAKYVVLTSKHHEGFTNWPSKASWNWNAMDTGPHRDLVGDLASAIRNNTDIHFGLYFSQFEWFNPLYLADKANKFSTQTYVKEVSFPQMYEIVNMYKPDVIWSDGDWEAPDTYWNSTEFLAWLYNESPVKDTVCVNDRWGQGTSCKHGGYFSCSDRYNPHKLQTHKWESAMTIDKSSWGFRREATLSDYLTIEEILSDLVSVVSCGGNLLVNIGPTHDGRIVPIFEERLRQLGAWLSINGEAIYGTVPFTHQNDSLTPDVWYTQHPSDGSVYAIALSWPDNYQLGLGSVTPVTSSFTVELLGYGPLNYNLNTTGMFVTLPNIGPESKLQWAWALKFNGVKPISGHDGIRLLTERNVL